jgi:hypothetical protein
MAMMQSGSESVAGHMVTVYLPQGGSKTEQQGYDVSLNIVVSSKEVTKVVYGCKNF